MTFKSQHKFIHKLQWYSDYGLPEFIEADKNYYLLLFIIFTGIISKNINAN